MSNSGKFTSGLFGAMITFCGLTRAPVMRVGSNIVKSTLRDNKKVALNFVNEPMLLGNTPGEVAA